jgi:GTP-binding protein
MDSLNNQLLATTGRLLPQQIRNIAIIAHVDHGKTTLVDKLLRQTGVFRSNEELVECVMDSNDLERERGVTILAKNTAIVYKDYHINIIDTPGHADFGGEVERVLGMVDCVILLVDAREGPMPQTRFVLKKALERGLKPIVVINKIDRDNVDINATMNKVFDLFMELIEELGADEELALFPHVFASGLAGFAKLKLEDESDNMFPLLDLIVSHCPPPKGDPDAALQMSVRILDYSDFLGQMSIGEIANGTVTVGQQVALLKDNGVVVKGKISKILKFLGLKRIEADSASAGEIVAIAGFDDFEVADTIASSPSTPPLPRTPIDEPTLNMSFLVNDSPFFGKEGKFVTSRELRARLMRELKTNVSLRVTETADAKVFSVSGRGEMHLGVLIETMRREGYEFAVSRPKVIIKNIDGQDHEPFERLFIDVKKEFDGAVIEELGQRKAEMIDMQVKGDRTYLEYVAPTRGLLGFESLVRGMCKGNATVNRSFLEFRPWCGEIAQQRPGALKATSAGKATGYALAEKKDCGMFFIEAGTEVYAGMIVGENSRQNDLGINVCDEKKLSNVRTKSSEGIQETPRYRALKLEDWLTYIRDDELVEFTPKSIRGRKRDLNAKR